MSKLRPGQRVVVTRDVSPIPGAAFPVGTCGIVSRAATETMLNATALPVLFDGQAHHTIVAASHLEPLEGSEP